MKVLYDMTKLTYNCPVCAHLHTSAFYPVLSDNTVFTKNDAIDQLTQNVSENCEECKIGLRQFVIGFKQIHKFEFGVVFHTNFLTGLNNPSPEEINQQK